MPRHQNRGLIAGFINNDTDKGQGREDGPCRTLGLLQLDRHSDTVIDQTIV